MRSSPDPDRLKPPRRRLFRAFDTNSRDENSQRHEGMVHISCSAIDAPSGSAGVSAVHAAEESFRLFGKPVVTARMLNIWRLVWIFLVLECRVA